MSCDNYIIVKDNRRIRTCDVTSDCAIPCIPIQKCENLNSILKKLCNKIVALETRVAVLEAAGTRLQFVAEGGEDTYSSSTMTNISANNMNVFRNGLAQYNTDPGDGDSYFTKNTSSNLITFFPTLAEGDKIIITFR